MNLIFECFAEHGRYSANHINRQLKKAEDMGVPEYEFFDRLLFALKTLSWRIREKYDTERMPYFKKLEQAETDSERNEIIKEILDKTPHLDDIPLPFDPVKDGSFPDMPDLFMQDLANFDMDIQNLIEEKKAEKREAERREAEKREAEKNKTEQEPEIQDSGFRLTKKKGAKADLLRVLNALYELNFFADKDNNTRKVQFMKAFGKLINEDFANYDSDLSQAYKAKLEANLEIFDKLKKKATDIFNERLDKTN